MITFGFRNKTGGLLRAVAAMVLGGVIMAFPSSALKIVVQVIAAFLIASGLVSLIFGFVNRQNGGFPLMLTNTVVDIILGVVIFMFPAEVASVVMFVIGLVLMLFGIFHISALLSASKVITVGVWTYVMPVLCAVGGAMVIFHPFGLGEFLTVVVGIALLLYGVSELVSSWNMHKAMKEYEIKFNTPVGEKKKGTDDDSGVKDVDYEKI